MSHPAGGARAPLPLRLLRRWLPRRRAEELLGDLHEDYRRRRTRHGRLRASAWAWRQAAAWWIAARRPEPGSFGELWRGWAGDLRFTGRLLLKRPGLSAVVVLTLGLCIGAGTAVFAVVRGAILDPWPYEAPFRIVVLRGETPSLDRPLRTWSTAGSTLPAMIDTGTERSFDRVADLTVEIEALELHGHDTRVSDWVRRTTEVRLSGDGVTGRGEDVVWDADDQLAYQARGPQLQEALRGSHTLAELSRRLDELPLYEPPPDRDDHLEYRRWGVESAALDLALRQAGRSLGELLGLSPRPLRFVASKGLPGPEGMEPLRRLLAAHPEVDLKLDAVSGWTDEMIAELADSGRVAVIDFKGAYVGTPVDTELDLDLYRRVLDAFPEALIEDPHTDPACLELLEPHRARVTWDAPFHSAADLDEFPWRPEIVNIKPSRFGTVESLLDTYDHCRREGIGMYGGGQHELSVGRDQIQALAALFHPDAPNDVAPREYNTDADPGELPGSPLPPPPPGPGLS